MDRLWTRWLALACAVAAAVPLMAVEARADPAAAAAPREGALSLAISIEDSPVSAEAVTLAVAEELGIDVAESPVPAELGLLRVRVLRHDVSMTYVGPAEQVVSRSVQLPEEPDRQVEVIALLAGNLARDEAGELLERMRAAREAREAAMAAAAASAVETREDESKRPVPVRREQTQQPENESSVPPPAADASSPDRPPFAPRPAGYPEQLPWIGANFSLNHPTAFYPDSERYEFGLELGVLHSRIGALRGFGLTLGTLQVDGPVRGAASGLVWCSTRGDVAGVQHSLVGSEGEGALRGMDAGLVFNQRRGAVQGAQFSLAYNQVGGTLQGGQVALAFNRADSRVVGGQLAVSLNAARGPLEGAQVSAGANLVHDRVVGGQLGLYNQAGDVDGVQIGLVNVGARVRGAQIGVVNVADDVQGLPVGLVNVVGTGRINALSWADSHSQAHVGVRYLNHHIYTLLAAGYGPDHQEMATSLALGGEITLSPFYLDIDGMYALVTRFEPGYEDDDNQVRLRALLGLEIVRGFAVFAGGGPEAEEERRGEWVARGYGLAGIQLF